MKEMEWISVKDRFPENERTVLIAVCRKWYNCPSEYYNFVAKAFHTDGKHHTEESPIIFGILAILKISHTMKKTMRM